MGFISHFPKHKDTDIHVLKIIPQLTFLKKGAFLWVHVNKPILDTAWGYAQGNWNFHHLGLDPLSPALIGTGLLNTK